MAGLIKLVIVLAVIGVGVKYFVLKEKSERDVLLDFAVREISKMKGQMIDNQTMVKGVYESSRGIVVNYQLIDFQEAFFDRDAMKKELQRNAKRKNCGKRVITDVLDLDINISYVYFNAVDKKLAEVVMDKHTCG